MFKQRIAYLIFVSFFSLSALALDRERHPELIKSDYPMAKDGGSDGGQFLYSETIHQLKSIQQQLSQVIENAPQETLNTIAQKFNVQIDWRKFAKIIAKTQIEPARNMLGKNEQGVLVPKEMHYLTSSRRIVALQPFFASFSNSTQNETDLTTKMYLRLLHESSHLFKIGIDNQSGNYDSISKQFALALYQALRPTWNNCGLNGSLQDRIQNCAKTDRLAAKLPELHMQLAQRRLDYENNLNGFPKDLRILRHDSGVLLTGVINQINLKAWDEKTACQDIPNFFKAFGEWTLPTEDELFYLISFRQALLPTTLLPTTSRAHSSDAGDTLRTTKVESKTLNRADALNDCFLAQNSKKAICLDETFVPLDSLRPDVQLSKVNSKLFVMCVHHPVQEDGNKAALPNRSERPGPRKADWGQFLKETIESFTGWGY